MRFAGLYGVDAFDFRVSAELYWLSPALQLQLLQLPLALRYACLHGVDAFDFRVSACDCGRCAAALYAGHELGPRAGLHHVRGGLRRDGRYRLRALLRRRGANRRGQDHPGLQDYAAGL